MFVEVLAFVQPSCPACHQLRGLLDQAAAHYAQCGSVLKYIDVSQQPLLADTFGVTQTPTIIGTKNWQPLTRMVGAENAQQRLAAFYAQLFQGAASCPVGAWRGDV
ncbi:hypothetical protein LCGC14_2553750 [marine sediment metagenome]|uniref:Thioredoxin domain-containing protein n=1 Tax=marine sediment metagenome TaxID=412755 RepID=A0A0F9AMN8_9ZZZZ